MGTVMDFALAGPKLTRLGGRAECALHLRSFSTLVFGIIAI
jgi:hypothetical protein